MQINSHVMHRRLIRPTLVGLLIWPLIAWMLAEYLVVSSKLPSADAIVVLAGAKVYVERTRRAAELYHEGRAPLVVLTDDGLRSAWSAATHGNPSYAERAADEL